MNVRGNRDVTAVKHGRPGVEGVGLEGNVVSSADFTVSPAGSWGALTHFILEIQPTRPLTDTRRAETSTWAVRCSGVEWGADESNVVDGIGILKARLVRKTTKGRDARKDGVGLIY